STQAPSRLPPRNPAMAPRRHAPRRIPMPRKLNPTEDRTWYEIVAAATDDVPVEILIFDDIASYGVSAANFDRDLKAIGSPASKKATLRINSRGGETAQAASIYNML